MRSDLGHQLVWDREDYGLRSEPLWLLPTQSSCCLLLGLWEESGGRGAVGTGEDVAGGSIHGSALTLLGFHFCLPIISHLLDYGQGWDAEEWGVPSARIPVQGNHLVLFGSEICTWENWFLCAGGHSWEEQVGSRSWGKGLLLFKPCSSLWAAPEALGCSDLSGKTVMLWVTDLGLNPIFILYYLWDAGLVFH